MLFGCLEPPAHPFYAWRDFGSESVFPRHPHLVLSKVLASGAGISSTLTHTGPLDSTRGAHSPRALTQCPRVHLAISWELGAPGSGACKPSAFTQCLLMHLAISQGLWVLAAEHAHPVSSHNTPVLLATPGLPGKHSHCPHMVHLQTPPWVLWRQIAGTRLG